MSTRSIILVTDKQSTVRLYKHSDGYPTGNLEVLDAAIEQATRQVSTHNAKWNKINGSGDKKISVSQLVGKIIGAATSEYGMGAYLEESFNEAFKPEHLGDQWDLEWLYIVNTEKMTIEIYQGNFTTGPQAGYRAGLADPMKYADKLRAEFQDEERAETARLIGSLEAWSFKVNPEPVSKPRAKRATKPKAKIGLSLAK